MQLTKARRSLVVLVAGAALLVPAGASQGAPAVIRAEGRTWSPDFKHVVPGSRVVWKNPTSRRHTLTAWGGNWSKDVSLAPGTRTAKTFRREGQFAFRCKRHSTVSNGECNGMCGLIHVAPN